MWRIFTVLEEYNPSTLCTNRTETSIHIDKMSKLPVLLSESAFRSSWLSVAGHASQLYSRGEALLDISLYC